MLASHSCCPFTSSRAVTSRLLPSWLGGNRAKAFHRLATDDTNDLEADGPAAFHTTTPFPASADRPSGRWCPEEEAGPVSRLLFSWVSGLLRLGMAKTLHQEDLWDVAQADAAHLVSATFQSHLLATADDLAAPEGRVGLTMWRVHGRQFIYAGVVKFIHDAVMFMGPFLLEIMLKHVQAGGSAWLGVGLAAALAGAAIVETITVNVYFHTLFRICLHLKTALVDMLYKKSLKVSAAAKSDAGVGAIVNLQSNDAAKLWSLPQYL